MAPAAAGFAAAEYVGSFESGSERRAGVAAAGQAEEAAEGEPHGAFDLRAHRTRQGVRVRRYLDDDRGHRQRGDIRQPGAQEIDCRVTELEFGGAASCPAGVPSGIKLDPYFVPSEQFPAIDSPLVVMKLHLR